jgi:hypothetical protein
MGPALAGLAAVSTLTLGGGPASTFISRTGGPQHSVLPDAPPPAPAPPTGGGSPASADAPGTGFLILLALAGLLSLGAPSVARKLRLAGESCGASAFVLIPERPG